MTTANLPFRVSNIRGKEEGRACPPPTEWGWEMNQHWSKISQTTEYSNRDELGVCAWRFPSEDLGHVVSFICCGVYSWRWLLTWGSPLPFLPCRSHRAWKCVGFSSVTPVSSGAWETWVSMDVSTCGTIITAVVGTNSIHAGEVACCVWYDGPHSVEQRNRQSSQCLLALVSATWSLRLRRDITENTVELSMDRRPWPSGSPILQQQLTMLGDPIPVSWFWWLLSSSAFIGF